MIELDYDGESLSPMFGRYENGRTALQLLDQMNLPYATITVNLPDDALAEGEHFIKCWSENEQIVESLIEAGWLLPTGRTVTTGYTQATVCIFTGALAREYEEVSRGA